MACTAEPGGTQHVGPSLDRRRAVSSRPPRTANLSLIMGPTLRVGPAKSGQQRLLRLDEAAVQNTYGFFHALARNHPRDPERRSCGSPRIDTCAAKRLIPSPDVS